VEQWVMQQNQGHGTQPDRFFKPFGGLWFQSSQEKKFHRPGTFPGFRSPPMNASGTKNAPASRGVYRYLNRRGAQEPFGLIST
jgi:hypothetical protein